MKRLATVLTLAMASLAFSVAITAPAHADPGPSLVPTGTTLVYVYHDQRYDGKLTVDVAAKNAGTDAIDVTLDVGVVTLSGSGTMKELPTLFALDFWLDFGPVDRLHFIAQIKRSTGEGNGKHTLEGTHTWFPWYTLGFYTK
jgi:hypothetical protein